VESGGEGRGGGQGEIPTTFLILSPLIAVGTQQEDTARHGGRGGGNAWTILLIPLLHYYLSPWRWRFRTLVPFPATAHLTLFVGAGRAALLREKPNFSDSSVDGR